MTEQPNSSSWVPGFIALSAIWGASFVFIKVSDRALGPNEVALARVTIGALVLCVLLAARRERPPRQLRAWGHLAFVALVGTTLPFCLFAYGETHISSVLAGMWNATTPLMTLLVALVILRAERPTRERTAGLLVGFLGVIVLLGPWTGLSGGALIGDGACLLAAFLYGVMITYTRRFITPLRLAPISAAAGQLICAAVQLAITLPFIAQTPGHITASIALSLIGLGALGTGLAYAIYHSLVTRVGATTTSTVTYVIPLWSTALGVIVLGERLHWFEPVGAVIVLAGVALSQQAGRSLRGARARRRRARIAASQLSGQQIRS